MFKQQTEKSQAKFLNVYLEVITLTKYIPFCTKKTESTYNFNANPSSGNIWKDKAFQELQSKDCH